MTGCGACGFVQLSICPPAEFVAPRVPWIRYNEPERHLDEVAAGLAACLGRPGRAFGIGPFDSPLLACLAHSGWNCDRLDVLDGVVPPPGVFPYLETIQAQLRTGRMQDIAAEAGRADLVVCRYLLEHSHDPLGGLAALGVLLNGRGHLIVEVPDSSKFLSRHDYSFIWEEHISYFTERTLRRLFRRAGCEVVLLLRHEGLLEDLLLAVVRPGAPAGDPERALREEMTQFAEFAGGFAATRDAYRARLGEVVGRGGKVGLFGVGHQSVMFLNALGLGPQIALLADDHPDKIGRYAPGAAAPIVTSGDLDSDPALAVCLLSTNPGIADKMRTKLRQFLARGGETYSIFAGIEGPTLIEQPA